MTLVIYFQKIFINNSSIFFKNKMAHKRNPRIPSKPEKSETVYVLTYKTNSTRVIIVANYNLWVFNHLLKVVDLALLPKVISLFEEAKKLIVG